MRSAMIQNGFMIHLPLRAFTTAFGIRNSPPGNYPHGRRASRPMDSSSEISAMYRRQASKLAQI